MLADTDHLLRKHIPRRQNGNERLFMGRQRAGRIQDILPHEIAVRDRLRILQLFRNANCRKDAELPGDDLIRLEVACIELGRGDAHQIAGTVDVDRQMRCTFSVVDTPVCVITENTQMICRRFEIGKTIAVAPLKSIQIFFELLICHEKRHHGEDDRRPIPLVVADGVVFYHLCVFVIDAGHDIALGRVVDSQMIDVVPRC